MTLQKPNQVSYEPSTYSQRLPRGVKNERIFRILLCNPEGTLTRYKIAKLAQAQQIQVSLLLNDLEKSDFYIIITNVNISSGDNQAGSKVATTGAVKTYLEGYVYFSI